MGLEVQEVAQQMFPRKTGTVDVRDDEIVGLVPRHGLRLLAGEGGLDLVPLFTERVRHELQDIGLLVDQ